MSSEKPAPQVSLELARLLIAIEKYGFSLAFLFFAWSAADTVWFKYNVGSHLNPDQIKTVWDLGLVFLVRQGLLLIFNLFIGIGLLTNTKPKTYPDRYAEIFFPMLGTFLALAINFGDRLPTLMTASLLPEPLQKTLAVAAVPLSILGYSISIWGIATLGRSFGALVAVRQVKLGGPYRFVRHPIYCGYLFETTGLILSTLSPFTVIWGILAVGVQICRAMLEERRLAADSEDYRRFQREVGFILPFIGRKS